MAAARPVLSQLNVVTRDFDASLAFYRALGLEIPESASPPDGIRHLEVAFGVGVTLELDNHQLAQTYNSGWRRSGGSRVLLGFAVPTRDDVDQRYAALIAAGYEGRQVPYDAFWGARYAIVADPDGNDVGLMSPIDQSRRSWPPCDSPVK